MKRLARVFLDADGCEHAERVEHHATQLLACHVTGTEAERFRRDMCLAAWLHDWFRSLPPGRMLSLARDWRLPIGGVEWNNPQLLHGPLAAELFERLLRGCDLLGEIDFAIVKSMVVGHTIGCSDGDDRSDFGDAIFFLADRLAAHEHLDRDRQVPEWAEIARKKDQWQHALQIVRRQKVDDLHAAGVTVHPSALEATREYVTRPL